MEKEKYYITTAIAYTSGKPHIGNTYDVVLADAIARFKKLQGYDVYFQTGTDEHGIKIQEKAEALGIKPKEYVDEIAREVKEMYDALDVKYDMFIRTTDEDHERIVKKIFKKMYDKTNGSIIIISHQERILNIADRIIVIADGKVADDGKGKELLPELLGTQNATGTCAVLKNKVEMD